MIPRDWTGWVANVWFAIDTSKLGIVLYTMLKDNFGRGEENQRSLRCTKLCHTTAAVAAGAGAAAPAEAPFLRAKDVCLYALRVLYCCFPMLLGVVRPAADVTCSSPPHHQQHWQRYRRRKQKRQILCTAIRGKTARKLVFLNGVHGGM